ncbi:MAG: NADPH-dependent 2,4-dienoyl-CoA reductase/sulfur reductase-like enzyme [Sphingobacteriales bacterium]|jgi:NADPH-dependent 2,4-dienoyl-CoA reductase/sulfur reductase-like enzyme
MKVVIIGNGVSGVTTARYIRKMDSSAEIVIISGETEYHYSRTALMYIYMGHMRFENTKPYEDYFWQKNRIDLVFDWVENVDYKNKSLVLKSGQNISYDKLVLATGSKSNMFGWPGQDLPGVQGLYSYQDLETLEHNTVGAKKAVIVGGGLIGVELGEMLLTRGIEVTYLVRETHYWGNILPKEESTLIAREMAKHDAEIIYEDELAEVHAGSNGKAEYITTKKGVKLEADIVGLTAGVSPAVDFLKDSDLEIQRGIMVNNFLETNITDVYALGDCAQFREPKPGHAPVEQLWYTGKMQGKALASTICGKKREYERGTWYNSAKFFDLEYQTYGMMFSNATETEDTWYWEDSKNYRAFRITWNKESKTLVGLNFFGMRFRHDVAERWIRKGKSLEYCLEHLPEGNFDPEFYTKNEDQIIAAYNAQFGTSIKSIKRPSLIASIF